MAADVWTGGGGQEGRREETTGVKYHRGWMGGREVGWVYNRRWDGCKEWVGGLNSERYYPEDIF